MLNHTCCNTGMSTVSECTFLVVTRQPFEATVKGTQEHVHWWSHVGVFPQGAGDGCGQREEQAEAQTVEPPVHLQRGTFLLCNVVQAALDRTQSDASLDTGDRYALRTVGRLPLLRPLPPEDTSESVADDRST